MPGTPYAQVQPVAAPRRRLSRRVVALGAGLLVLIGAAAVAAVVLLGGSGSSAMARDFVTKMAARDSTVSTLLELGDSFRMAADSMGLVRVPGSVSLSVENIQVTVPVASPAASKLTNGDSGIKATYTLKWSGHGKSGQTAQTLSAVVHKGTDGKTHLVQIVISPTMGFDLESYFGVTGISEADADKVAADLTAGTKWIPGVSVEVTPRTEDIHSAAVITLVPGHLASWSETVSPEVPGTRTTWDVQVSGASVTNVQISPATAITSEEVAAQVNEGAVSETDAIAAAAALQTKLVAAIQAGDVVGANALISGPKVDASGEAAMKDWTGTDSGSATEGPSGPEVSLGGYVYVMGSDGRWTADSARSPLIASVRSGTGAPHEITGSSRNASTGAVACSTTITISLVKVLFYTNVTVPNAIFSFVSSADCDMSDSVLEATVGWSGNSGGTTLTPMMQGADPGTSVLRNMLLPDGVTSDKHPIWINITKYGEEGGAILPNAMMFTTN